MFLRALMKFIQETRAGLSSQIPSRFHFKYVSLYLKLFCKVLTCPAQGEKGATAAESTVIDL